MSEALIPRTSEDIRRANRGEIPRPSWWLVVTAEDFNALQLAVSTLELQQRSADQATALTWLMELVYRLRAWAEGWPPPRLDWAHPANTWVAADALGLLQIAGRVPLLYLQVEGEQQPLWGELMRVWDQCNLLIDLSMRIYSQATTGRVGNRTHPVGTVGVHRHSGGHPE